MRVIIEPYITAKKEQVKIKKQGTRKIWTASAGSIPNIAIFLTIANALWKQHQSSS